MIKKNTVIISLLIGVGMAFAGCKNSQKETGRISMEIDTLLNDDLRLIVGGEFMENDTLFFLQEYLKNWENRAGNTQRNTIIYLEPDSNSFCYNPEFWIDHFDEQSCATDLRDWLSFRKEKKVADALLKKVPLFDLPVDWIPLHHRNGKAYVLTPCEVDFPPQIRLTDSLIVKKRMDFVFTPMVKSEQCKPNVYRFDLESDNYSSLYVYIIDERTKCAVWHWEGKTESAYYLMIPVTSVRDFDMVHCGSYLMKFAYNNLWEPDEVDVKSLLESVQAGKKVDIYNLQ